MVSVEQILSEFESLRSKEHLPNEYVGFRADLYRAQREAQGRLGERRSLDHVLAEHVEMKTREGFHILDLDRVEIEKEALKLLYLNICEAIQNHAEWDTSDIARLKELVVDGQLDLQTLIRKAAQKDMDYIKSLSQALNIETEYLYYFGIQVGKPIFEVLAGKMKSHIGKVVWKDGICPICGNEPDMAKLEREEGRRIVHCFLCDTEWAFRRLQCPFCLNDDHETLRFFFTEESSPYRVDVCDMCRKYIKTIDERKLDEGKEVHFAVEDVATLFLDMLAISEGYTCPEHHILHLQKEKLST